MIFTDAEVRRWVDLDGDPDDVNSWIDTANALATRLSAAERVALCASQLQEAPFGSPIGIERGRRLDDALTAWREGK